MSPGFPPPFDPRGEPPAPEEDHRAAIGVILAVAAASILFWILKQGHLEHTSLVFIGIPTVLAILTVQFVPRPRTVTGVILKAITLALLVSGIVLREGFICIVMASPLFILVGVIIGKIAESNYWRHTRRGRRVLSVTVFSFLSVCSMEGVLPGFHFDREESVTVTRIVPLGAGDVAASLARTPRFDAPLPLFFRARFPRPAAASGQGLRVGDMRSVLFTHAGHHPGTLVMRVSRSAPGAITFDAVSDDSYIKHWLTWEGADVVWSAVDATHTRVSWTVRYRRTLDPAWYFGPWERYGARLAAGYLIATAASGS
jgi:hypothetical protein